MKNFDGGLYAVMSTYLITHVLYKDLMLWLRSGFLVWMKKRRKHYGNKDCLHKERNGKNTLKL